MSAKNVIDSLFEDEKTSVTAPESEKVPSAATPLQLKPSKPEKKAASPAAAASSIERREFTRVDIGARKLELKFTHGAQFARQYIDNISLGGLFVKTETKAEMGALMAIEFSVPQPNSNAQRHFRLMGKVCRVANDGLGLEFINTSLETRQELEQFVRSSLPKGQSVLTRPKASSIENLEKLREDRLHRVKAQKKLAIQIAVIVLLAIFNIWLMSGGSSQEEQQQLAIQRGHLLVDGKKIAFEKINAVEKTPDGKVRLKLAGDTSVTVRPEEVEKQLPFYLNQTLKVLEATPTLPPIRENQTSPRLTQMPYLPNQ